MFTNKEKLIIESLSDRFLYRIKSYRAIQKMIDDMIANNVYQRAFTMKTESKERFLKDIEPFVNKKLVRIEQDENTIIVTLGISSLDKESKKEETIDLDKVDYEGLYLELKDKLPDEWWATESKRRTVQKLIYDILFDRDTRGYQDIKEDVEAIYMRLEELYKPSPINVEYIELVKYLANKFVFPFDNEAVFSKLPPIDGTKTAYEYFLKKIIPFLDVEWLEKVDEKFISYIKREKELIGNIVFDIYKANKYKFEATEEDLRIVPESSIQRLRDAVSKIKTVNLAPSSEKYQELVKLIEKQKPFAQLQIYGADIRFASYIAQDQLLSKRRSIFDYIHRLYPDGEVPIYMMKNENYTIIKNELTYKDIEPLYDRFIDRMYDYLIFESVIRTLVGRKLSMSKGYRLYRINTPLGLKPVKQNKDLEPLKKLMKNKVINEMINGIKILFKEDFGNERTDHYEWNIDFGTLGRSKDDPIAVNSYENEQIVVQIWFDKIIISHNDTYNKTFKTIIEYDLHNLRLIVNERFFANYLRDKTPQNIIDKLRGNKTNPMRKNGGGAMPQYFPPDFESKGMIPVEYYDCLEPISVSFYAEGGTKLIKSKPYKPIPIGERVKVYFQLHAMKHPQDFYGTIESNCEYTYNEIKKLDLPKEEENLRIGGSIYSIKHGNKWPVASHNRTVVLNDVVFTVQRSLLIKIKEEIAKGGSGGSAKVAGAFADGFYEGKLDSKDQKLLIDNWYANRDSMLESGYRQILFNPRFHDSFMVVDQWEGTGSWEYFQNTTLEERLMMEEPVYTAEAVYFLSDPYKLAHPRAQGYPYLILARGVNLKKDKWKVKVNTNTPKPYTISRVLKKPRGK